jgi:hypothetical protein
VALLRLGATVLRYYWFPWIPVWIPIPWKPVWQLAGDPLSLPAVSVGRKYIRAWQPVRLGVFPLHSSKGKFVTMVARARRDVSFPGNRVSFMRVSLLTPVLTSTVNWPVRT